MVEAHASPLDLLVPSTFHKRKLVPGKPWSGRLRLTQSEPPPTTVLVTQGKKPAVWRELAACVRIVCLDIYGLVRCFQNLFKLGKIAGPSLNFKTGWFAKGPS